MRHLRLLLLSIILLVVGLLPCRLAWSEATSLEFRVKAVVLFNFAKYVHWPDAVFTSKDQPIRVCLLGENPFGDIFLSDEAPKEAQNRPLKVIELPADPGESELKGCQLLYWREKYEATVQKFMPLLRDHHVLTVADKSSSEALISFIIENEKVRFRIKYKAAKALGFEMSSQLLKLATIDD